jgi:predicted ABC-type ATPase
MFAGANGCGKTTLAKTILPKKGILEFVNADEIAQGLSPLNPVGQKVAAGKLLIQRVTTLIKAEKSFALETTLSGKSLLHHIKAAHAQNFNVQLYYIYTETPDINIQRIKKRVQEGGHHVPAADVRRRAKRSLYHLFHTYQEYCDIINLYDNSYGNMSYVAQKKDGQFSYNENQIQIWRKILKQADKE